MEKPLYGTITYFGGEYSVTFAPTKTGGTSVRFGYGDFPFDRYPGLPVVNFYQNEAVIAAQKWRGPMPGQPGGDLEAYLAFVAGLGIEVRNWKGK